MNRCPLFVELCAGTVAVSLRLQGGNRCRPVVSRMGAKTGYANVILACFGLTPGGKADAYLWCEPDPGARLLLQALPQPEVLREAASVLCGWASQDPRTLWEALRKEGPPKGVDGREVARWSYVVGASWKGQGTDYRSCETSGGGGLPMTVTGLAARWLDRPSLPPTTITEDARTVDPREVARWVVVAGQMWCHKMDGRPLEQWAMKGLDDGGVSLQTLIGNVDVVPEWPPVAVTSDAREIKPPLLPVGTVCLIDPPYVQTTGYGHELPRAEVVRLARLWADAGAFVGVCEQEPIPELIADGWHAVEITHGRKGQKRTFSKQQHEYLTLNRPPVNPPLLGVQEDLW